MPSRKELVTLFAVASLALPVAACGEDEVTEGADSAREEIREQANELEGTLLGHKTVQVHAGRQAGGGEQREAARGHAADDRARAHRHGRREHRPAASRDQAREAESRSRSSTA